MEYITKEHPLFYQLYFSINENDCLIEPLIITLSEYSFQRLIDKEEELNNIVLGLKNSLYEQECIRGKFLELFKTDKNKCSYSNKYLKRKYR